MTRLILNIDKKTNIYFDCENHAEDHDVCTIISTLCNVLVAEMIRIGLSPQIYQEGHVRIEIPEAGYLTAYLFQTVKTVFEEVAEQEPKHVRIY